MSKTNDTVSISKYTIKSVSVEPHINEQGKVDGSIVTVTHEDGHQCRAEIYGNIPNHPLECKVLGETIVNICHGLEND